MPSFFKAVDRMKPFFDSCNKAVMALCKCLLVIDILIIVMQVSGRYIWFIPDPPWTEEVILTLMCYMGLIAAAMALRRDAHIRMTVFDKKLPAKVVVTLDILADIVVVAFAVVMIRFGLAYATGLGAKGFYTSMPKLSKFWMYFPVPLAGFFAILFEIEIILNHIKLLFVKEPKATGDVTDKREVVGK